jgi:hypothetical protein
VPKSRWNRDEKFLLLIPSLAATRSMLSPTQKECSS